MFPGATEMPSLKHKCWQQKVQLARESDCANAQSIRWHKIICLVQSWGAFSFQSSLNSSSPTPPFSCQYLCKWRSHHSHRSWSPTSSSWAAGDKLATFLWYLAAFVFMQSPAFQGMLIKIVERKNTCWYAVIDPSGKTNGCQKTPSNRASVTCKAFSWVPSIAEFHVTFTYPSHSRFKPAQRLSERTSASLVQALGEEPLSSVPRRVSRARSWSSCPGKLLWDTQELRRVPASQQKALLGVYSGWKITATV